MVNKGKYWIFEKNKGITVSYFKERKGTHKGTQYSISLKMKCILIKFNNARIS